MNQKAQNHWMNVIDYIIDVSHGNQGMHLLCKDSLSICQIMANLTMKKNQLQEEGGIFGMIGAQSHALVDLVIMEVVLVGKDGTEINYTSS